MNTHRTILIGTALFFACATGCSKSSEPQEETATQEAPAAAQPTPAAPAPAANPASEAKTYFKTRCVVCHGETGAGDGPGAAALDPKPRTFSDASWQDKVTDDHLKKVITEGGAAVGLSPGMPAHPDIKKKPEVLDELVKLVREFRKE